jgi:hypothetical protein
MTATPLQFDIDFSGKLPASAQAGMAQADENARSEWKRVIDGLILNVALEMQEFTVDEIVERFERLPFPPRTHRLCAIGPRMKEVAKTLKYMEPTPQVVRGTRPVSKGNFHRVWRSLVYGRLKP